MANASYAERRSQLTTYFDRTAVEAWARLTSDAPVSKIRATVRAGRDTTRSTLLSWLPDDLTGKRILDAGCGTGALSVEAARRGAEVVAIDVSPTLVGLDPPTLPAAEGMSPPHRDVDARGPADLPQFRPFPHPQRSEPGHPGLRRMWKRLLTLWRRTKI